MSGAEFLWQRCGDFDVLSCCALTELGISHGFIGTTADFSHAARASHLNTFLQTFGASRLELIDQVHGDGIARLGETKKPADALFIPRPFAHSSERLAAGILVADCQAIFMLNSAGMCLVHAGWRGLAQRIHLKAIARLAELAPQETITIVIWPCASLNRYEVGPEVVEALGEGAVVEPATDGKYFLGVRETACKDFERFSARTQIFISRECTISNSALHSYRRSGASAGRNLAFVIL